MSGFLKFAYELIWQVITNIGNFFYTLGSAFGHLFTDFKEYANVFKAYTAEFNALQWVLAVLLVLVLLGILVLVIYKLAIWLRKAIISHREHINQEDLLAEIANLNLQVKDLIDEKSKIMAMKVSQLGLVPGEEERLLQEAEAKQAEQESRFAKLTRVDEKYTEYELPEFDNAITLPQIIENYRNYACSKLKLFYNEYTIRLFLAGMATSKLLILEGISGTGKTSLPYSFSRFLKNPATLISVQPSYRDRTELLGYFNEFTKRFNETEFLRSVYEASYRNEPCFIVLDEMNLARIEYYFAEMLSVLEMPVPEEWIVDLVPTAWSSDPQKLLEGKLRVPTNLWFVGTANNDDSTFTITDKVYDRAIPIEINSRGAAFEAPATEPINLDIAHLEALFAEAKVKHPLSEARLAKLEKLDAYMAEHFKLQFGNRIMKQIYDFVPVYVACGGTELEALDYLIARKILKKFESLNIAYVRDEIKDLITFIEKNFGKTALGESKAYLQRIQSLF